MNRASNTPRLKTPPGIWQSLLLLADRFFYSTAATSRSGPHVRDATSVQRLWNYFVLASLPAWLVGLWSLGRQTNLAIDALQIQTVPGWRGWLLHHSGIGFDPFSVAACLAHGLLWFLPIFGVALLAGAVWEALFATMRRRRLDEGLLATAWIFALALPATVPFYQVVLGMSFGIVVGKLIYGGSGRYLVNPALLGLAFLIFSYPALFYDQGTWVPVAGYDQPTLLELVTDEGGLKVIAALDYTWWQVFIGDHPGAVGTTSILGIALGAAFLIYTGMASWRVMAGALIGLLATVLLFNNITHDNPLFPLPWHWHMVLGGFAFGTVFLATDPVAGAMTDPGRWSYGLLVGGLTVVVRLINPSHYEGVMFAILFASMFSPLVDAVVAELNIRRRRRRMQGATLE